MALVVDASSLLLATAPDADTRIGDRLARLESSHEFLAPSILGYELVQFFHVKNRRGPVVEAARQVRDMLSAVRLVDPDWRRLGQLAAGTGLSAYDASYLEVAVRLRASLLTDDAKLFAAGTQFLGRGRVARLDMR